MPENATTPEIPHGDFRFLTGLHGRIRAFVLGPERLWDPVLHTGRAIVERRDTTGEAKPRRFGLVDVYSHDNGRTWGAENGHYDLTYERALRLLIESLTRMLPPSPDHHSGD